MGTKLQSLQGSVFSGVQKGDFKLHTGNGFRECSLITRHDFQSARELLNTYPAQLFYFPELIVKRFLRQFFSPKPNTLTVFTLRQPHLVEKEQLQRLNLLGTGPVYDCSSFATEGVRYPYSRCCDFAFGVDEGGNQKIF